MKKIIRKPINYRTYCEKCGCKFSYEYADIEDLFSREYYSKIVGYVVICPFCNTQCNHINENAKY